MDEPFARWCSDHNIRWSDSNFFVSDNVGTLSNCPMSGGTPVLYWNTAVNTWDTAAIGGLYYSKAPHETITVLSNGQKRQCRIRQFHEPWTYEIELANGAVIRTTSEHLNKVYSGDYVATKELTVNDYLPYTTVAYMGTQHMGYEKGKVIGIYLGAGSYYNPNTVTFHLDRSTQNACINFLKNYCKEHFNAILSYDDCDESNYVNMRVRSRSLKALLADFICQMDTPDQWINNAVIEQSIEFRQGILDGLYAVSGEFNNRVYIHSLSLRDSLVTMLASMGIVAFVTRDDQNGQTESDDTETGYIVRWYTSGMHHIVKNKYIIDPERQCFWVRIQRIVRNANPDADNDKGNTASYCLEMADDEEPVFMLANGIHTHNCRLLSDTTKLDAFINSIGGTALSVGSCRVSTINLVRIAYESGLDQKKYLKILRERATLDCKALYSMRHIIKRNIEKGLLPNYTEGGVELAKQYCTMGILGLYEVIDMFGMIRTDEAGNKSYSEEGVRFASEILDVLNDVKDHFTTEFSINMESIPAENCAGVICQADNLLYEQNRYFIYSNQWIPLTEKCTIQEKCRLGSLFDKKCGGGCICHINIENRFPDAETAWDMLNYVASHGVIYFAFTTKISVCESRHAFIGTATCPRCGKPVADTYARVVGFYVPVSKYQSIRRKEFDKRRWYDVLQKDSMFT